MTLYLIRHGETDWNKEGLIQGCEDIPLNAAGRTQAEQAAGALSRAGITSVWSSPLIRARESATLIAERCGIDTVRVLDNLRERDFGASGGLTREERLRLFPDEESISGQESFADLQKRALAALEHIAETVGVGRVLVVSHGAFIDSVIRHFNNTPWGGLATIRLKNCSLTRLDRLGGSFVMDWYDRGAESIVFPVTPG